MRVNTYILCFQFNELYWHGTLYVLPKHNRNDEIQKTLALSFIHTESIHDSPQHHKYPTKSTTSLLLLLFQE